MPPASALESCETALRQLLVYVLREKHGPEWMSVVFNEKQLAEFADRREYEQKKRMNRGVAVVSDTLIDYTQFYDLLVLAEKNWALVAPALGKKAVTGALLHRIDDLRNSVAHNRGLLPFEEDLVAGVAGEIRNRVTLYMSTQDEAGDYYARIEEVSDNFGNRIDGVETLEWANANLTTNLTLSVGQVVTFRCRASDPQGRTLTWYLETYPASYGPAVVATGGDVELQWTVTTEHVSGKSSAWVKLVSDSPYHRWPDGNDGFAAFHYRVDPPPS